MSTTTKEAQNTETYGTWQRGACSTVTDGNAEVMYDAVHDRYLLRVMVRGGINDWGEWTIVRRAPGVKAHKKLFGPPTPATDTFSTRFGIWTKGDRPDHVIWHHNDPKERGSTPEHMRLEPNGRVAFYRDGKWRFEDVDDGAGSQEALLAIHHFWGVKPKAEDPRTAASFLNAALGHMQDRATTYDRPQGERSMGNCVTAFNTITGHNLTEEQGWAFMAILKIVRTQQGKYRADNYEDLAAYAGLAGEAAARDRA